MIQHLNKIELEAGLIEILDSPKDNGRLEMIVRRPDIDAREVLEIGEVTKEDGLLGDNWKVRGSSKTEDGSSHPDTQINLMNARCIALITQDKERWKLAGDQLYVDLDLTDANLPAGSRISIGSSIIEITALPHTGCKKFAQRFGIDAVKFVNSEIGKLNHLRGVNAKVVQPGTFKTGDNIRKLKS